MPLTRDIAGISSGFRQELLPECSFAGAGQSRGTAPALNLTHCSSPEIRAVTAVGMFRLFDAAGGHAGEKGMLKELGVLIIEDNPDDAALITRVLKSIGRRVRYRQVENEPDLRDALAERQWDVVLSDFAMPRFNGMAALEIVRASSPLIPFILVSGAVGEETAVAAVKAGANDYVMKSNLVRLPSVVERELRDARLRIEHARSQQQIREVHERNQAIITTAPDGIITFDGAGIIESFNPAAESLFGLGEEEAIHSNIIGIVPALVDVIAARRSDCIAHPATFEATARRRDGFRFPVEVSVSERPFGEQGLLTAIIHDITNRKESEARIWTQFERLTALRAIDVAIAGSFDLRVTLQIILDQVTELLHVDAAAVLLVERETERLVCAASRGFSAPPEVRLRLDVVIGGTPPRFIESHMTEILDLTATGAFHHQEIARRERFHYYCSVPLVARGQVRGVLEVFHRGRREADADWASFFETLAGQAAIAIDSALMFEDLQQRNAEMLTAYDVTIEGWSRALDLRDKETEGHSQRVADLVVRLAREAGVAEEEIVHIRRGALLHDIGKLGVPDSILLKEGPLSDEEWAIMRQHPQHAYDWLAPISFLRKALEIPYSHHERWDGGGYPLGLRGEEIPLPARLFALVDVWDALTSDRPYRPAWAPEAACEMIRAGAGSHFDPHLTPLFLGIVMDARLAPCPEPVDPSNR